MNSVYLPLWDTAEKDLGFDATGIEALYDVIYKLQQVSSTFVRALVDDIKAILLIKYPGQDVNIFGVLVVNLCRHISGTRLAPTDIVVLASSISLKCDVLTLKLKSTNIYNELKKSTNSMI